MIKLGIEQLVSNDELQKSIQGNIALLAHSASVDANLVSSVEHFKKLFGNRFIKIFGPQHGFVCDVQDNMIETDDFIHPYYQLPVYSLYGKTRIPTDEMLEGVNTFVIDLQDVGTRVYTYISTMTAVMRKCAEKSIKVVVLDRPNPVGGKLIEGSVLEDDFRSFVGPLNIPQRHSLTMGEVAQFAMLDEKIDVELSVIKMDGWKREYYWSDLNRFWINPSPNLPTPESCITFCGTVLFEGTKLSEGRGTTRSLEVTGAPKIIAEELKEKIKEDFQEWGLEGQCILRPIVFHPTFQKHAGTTCGGFHIHPLVKDFESWKLGQFLLKIYKENLGEQFQWQDAPYEYESDRLAIDFINGNDKLRKWVDEDRSLEAFNQVAYLEIDEFKLKRKKILLY